MFSDLFPDESIDVEETQYESATLNSVQVRLIVALLSSPVNAKHLSPLFVDPVA